MVWSCGRASTSALSASDEQQHDPHFRTLPDHTVSGGFLTRWGYGIPQFPWHPEDRGPNGWMEGRINRRSSWNQPRRPGKVRFLSGEGGHEPAPRLLRLAGPPEMGRTRKPPTV